MVMSDEDAERIVRELMREYPDLPHPDHEPIRCQYYIRMYLYDRNLREFASRQN
jgi:hypothetical protein